MHFLHQVHSVRGEDDLAFEALYREQWMPLLADGDDARLLWYLDQTHGTGPAYTVVTITGIRDGAAWQRLDERIRDGDLRDWQRSVDSMRHDCVSKLLFLVNWSPMQDLQLHDVPAVGSDHPPTLFMEDTGWPYARLDEYIRFWDEGYHRHIEARPRDQRLLEVRACFETAFGTGRREATLMQRILDPARLLQLFAMPPQHRESSSSSTYMSDALSYRDQWESRLLRTRRWSPLD
jgi:hypothetical protein